MSFLRNKLRAITNLRLKTDTMSVSQIIETLVKRYERSSVLRALVQLVPLGIGSAVDTALMTRVSTIQANLTGVFFDELAKDERPLHPELLENNEFLHCYFATSVAATSFTVPWAVGHISI
jgi:hypothetical protein